MIERRWIFVKRFDALKAMKLIKGENMFISEGDEISPDRLVLHAEFLTASKADQANANLADHFAWNEFD